MLASASRQKAGLPTVSRQTSRLATSKWQVAWAGHRSSARDLWKFSHSSVPVEISDDDQVYEAVASQNVTQRSVGILTFLSINSTPQIRSGF
ncbi:unnamed protein product [Ilex paraguariensis]|uniref:Uncharacterized protein n=1 Tax=Ilex paraguariensis TaxID=185542 RepID=A0ABC8SCG0_9AQUA